MIKTFCDFCQREIREHPIQVVFDVEGSSPIATNGQDCCLDCFKKFPEGSIRTAWLNRKDTTHASR